MIVDWIVFLLWNIYIFLIFFLCGRDLLCCILIYFLICKLFEKIFIYVIFFLEGLCLILKIILDNGFFCVDVRVGIRVGSFLSILVIFIFVIVELKKIGYIFVCCICCFSFFFNSVFGIILLFIYDLSNDLLNGVNSFI